MKTTTNGVAKARYAVLGDLEERSMSIREALWQVRRAKYIAVTLHPGEESKVAVLDVSRAAAVRVLKSMLGRVKTVAMAEIFGTLVIG